MLGVTRKRPGAKHCTLTAMVLLSSDSSTVTNAVVTSKNHCMSVLL